MPEIDLIIGTETVAEDPDDEVPAMSAEAVTKPGDLWLLGNHRIYCGDARSSSSYATLMGNARADVVFTDPPYNTIIDGHASGNGRIHHNEFAMASGEMSEAEFTDFLMTVLGNLPDWSKSGSVHFVAMDWRHMPELLAAGKGAYESLLNVCVLNKDNGGMGSFYRSQHELIFVFKAGKASHQTTYSSANSGATVQTSGIIPARIRVPAPEKKAMFLLCTLQ